MPGRAFAACLQRPGLRRVRSLAVARFAICEPEIYSPTTLVLDRGSSSSLLSFLLYFRTVEYPSRFRYGSLGWWRQTISSPKRPLAAAGRSSPPDPSPPTLFPRRVASAHQRILQWRRETFGP